MGLNLYPMGNEAWFTFGAFEESRRFLQDPRVRHDRLAILELHLRHVLTQFTGRQAADPDLDRVSLRRGVSR